MRSGVKRAALETYLLLAGTRGARKANRLLVSVGLHGLGILNWHSLRESGEAVFLQRLLKGLDAPVVLDVGAHCGTYTQAVQRASPDAHVYAFEPHPVTFKRLRTLAQASGFTAIEAACGASSGRVALYDHAEAAEGSEHATLVTEVLNATDRDRRQWNVEVVTIDDTLRSLGIPSVALLKVDTEGTEYDVLRGASASIRADAIDVIQFEFNETHAVTRTFLRDFTDILPDYSLYRILPRGLLPLGSYSALEWELFAFQNIVAIAPYADWARRRIG